MLHSHDAVIPGFVNVLKHLGVIDFPGSGFFPTGIVSHLEVSDLIPTQVEQRDQVSSCDLL